MLFWTENENECRSLCGKYKIVKYKKQYRDSTTGIIYMTYVSNVKNEWIKFGKEFTELNRAEEQCELLNKQPYEIYI